MGNVTKLESTKDSGLFQQPLPGSDSTSAILLDLFGASRTLTLNGRYTAADGTLATLITTLDALVSGSQTSRSFVCDKTGVTYKVLVQSVTWTAEEAGVNFVDYTIVMTEGSV